ncbi:unnamed protein product [Ceutorhynchus assimilis]|uniref:CUB domain-containing protein n=1 Tax=Ceutorhynchus assimilis TaxID=467358 RepID=A0A9N9MA11_9CUCU|nr:unnamed protein product [Ceutorhynchus assimilis]
MEMGITWCDDESNPVMKLYNGPLDDSPLIGKYCATKLPPSITTDGSALHIKIFRAMDLFATYSVLDNHCGGDLQNDGGYIATPGWPKSYPANAQCSWTIAMGPGNTINLNFVEFNIPESEHCNTDFVEIRESNATGKLLGVFCGTNSAPNISAIGTLYLMFKSSDLGVGEVSTNRGFYVEFATTSENHLSGPEGYIGNRHYPNPIPASTYGYHSWLITTNSSTIIELTFLEFFFEINSGGGCFGNSLKVYDGMDANAPLVKEFCGSDSPDSILSTSNMMYVSLDFYAARVNAKFLLKWKELSKVNGKTATSNKTQSVCGYAYKLEGQTNVSLTSPGYPTGYKPNLNCEWIYEIDPQYHLRLRIIDLNFGGFGGNRICTYSDVLIVHTKANQDEEWRLVQEICTPSNISNDLIGANFLKVEFRTNKYLNGTGFQAIIFGDCGGTLTEPNGVITFDSDHAHGWTCQWNISVRTGRTIKLHFEEFDLSASNANSCRSFVIVRNGKFPDSPFLGIGKFCGPEAPPDMESSSNHLYIKYSGTVRLKGFKLKYSEVSFDCDSNIRLSSEETSVEITSPNYPNIPQAHSECTWIIRAPSGESLRVDFLERFDISTNSKCTTDYLELRDGGTTLSPLIGRYCHEMPNTLFTTDNMLNIKYFTDSNEPRNGFKAKVSISYCGGTFRGEGTINTQEPHVIKTGDNCTWHILAPIDNNIIMKFSMFNVAQYSVNCSENTGQVKLIELNPVSNDNNTEMTLCGHINATEYHSTGNKIVVNYLAKSDRDKFILNFKFREEECGGVIEQESGTITSPGYPMKTEESRYCIWRIRVPKGRRISMYTEDMDIEVKSTYLVVFEGFFQGPKILGEEDIQPQKTYETSDNTANIFLWRNFPNGRRGFKIKFTSNKPTVCEGDFNSTSGQILAPQHSAPYQCEWLHTKRSTSETLALSIVMETNATTAGSGICYRSSTGIHIIDSNSHKKYTLDSYTNESYALGRLCTSTNNRPHIFRSILPTTLLLVRKNYNAHLNFTISYKTYQCGGLLTDDEGVISSPNFPNAATDSVECSWHIELASSRIKVNFTSLNLADDCDKNYVIIYNGRTPMSPIIGKYCKNDHPELLVSQKLALLIEYRYVKDDNNRNPPKGFSFKYEPEIEGCGGVYQSEKVDIQTPNYGKDYGNNKECIWDVRSPVGNVIKLHFFDRFYIEESENCTKDYVEIFDSNDDKWVSLGKKCGRNLPGEILSSNNQLRIIFRSNEKITGSGFRASWNWHCGGTFVAGEKERYLMSPNYPNTFSTYFMNCTYKIISRKDQGVVSVKLLDFDLLGTGSTVGGMSSNCAYSNLTIAGASSASQSHINTIKQVYCGNDIPSVQRFKNAVIITYMSTYRYLRGMRGFKLVYKDESCGGNITSPASLESPSTRDKASQLSGYMKFYQARVSCNWYITAPPDQIPVLSVHNLSMTLGIHCIGQHLEVYDGLEAKMNKRLAQLCGKIDESKPIPATSNTMLVKLDSTAYNFNGFQGEVYFTYGPSVGCGGTINLTETKYINSPNNLPHMDCHWIIIAPQDNKVKIEFTDISISTSCSNPVRNHTYYCTCSYIEIRDGAGPFADVMAKLCSGDNHMRRTFTSSWNTAYIRLYSAVPQNDMFRVTIKPVQSKCGPSELIAEKEWKELTSPDYPNNYPENIKCTWVIRSFSNTAKFMIHFEEIDISGDSLAKTCDSDRLELTEDPNRLIISEGFGPRAKHQVQNAFGGSRETFKYAFCDNETKPFDYYSTSNEVTLTFHSHRYTGVKGKGFKLKYGYSGCNRTIYANEGRIQNDVVNSAESNCVITITADPNRTLSIYFMTFFFITADHSCSKLGLEIRENNSTGLQLFKACGFRLPSPIFTNTNKLYIHMYNLQKSASYFKYNFLYLSSENGKGCGGKMFNYMGKFSSPLYPNPYRKDIECTWNVMVPKGYNVALKFTDFNIGGVCLQNKVVVKTNTGGAETESSFCAEVKKYFV